MVNFSQIMAKNAFSLLPGQRTVSLVRNGSTIATGIKAVRRPLSYKDLQMLGGNLGVDEEGTTFMLQISSCSGQEPLNDDLLIDDESKTWKIQSGALELSDTIYRKLCIRVRNT